MKSKKKGSQLTSFERISLEGMEEIRGGGCGTSILAGAIAGGIIGGPVGAAVGVWAGFAMCQFE